MALATDMPEHLETINFPPFPPLLSKRATAFGLVVFIVDTFLLPAILYYILQFGTSLSKENVFNIVTSVAGALDLLHFVWRFWALMKKSSKFRPRGASRWADFVQYSYSIAVVIVVVELVIGTVWAQPLVRLCAMPIPSLLFQIGLTDLLMTGLHLREIPVPFRISSCTKGMIFRPSVYFYAEDLGAIDGNGGIEWREALDVRYHASRPLRQMFVKLSLFWSVPAVLVGGALTAIVFTVPESVAFGIGWVGAVPWFLVWGYVSYRWVKKVLDRELPLLASSLAKE